MSLSHTALSVVQLYHHILLPHWMYQVTVKMQRACHRKVILQQRALANSYFLSNKLIQSINHSCQSIGLSRCWDTHMPRKHKLQSCSSAWMSPCRLQLFHIIQKFCWLQQQALCLLFILVHSTPLTNAPHSYRPHPSVLWLSRTYTRNEP